MKKFELVKDDTIKVSGRTLYRIKACKSFTTITGHEVKVGDLGGYVEKTSNLSQQGKSWVGGNAVIGGNAAICGNAEIWGNAVISDNGRLFRTEHLLVIGAIGSRNGFTTFFRDKNNEITVECDWFHGSIADFIKKVEETHGTSKHAVVYKAAAELAKLQIDLTPEEGEAKK